MTSLDVLEAKKEGFLTTNNRNRLDEDRDNEEIRCTPAVTRASSFREKKGTWP
jgi:hypothetical protein